MARTLCKGICWIGISPSSAFAFFPKSSLEREKETLEAYSGFEGTELSEILREYGVKKIFICGLATDYCVRATALDARKEGFEVVLISDCVESVNIKAGDGEKAIQEMTEFGCAMLKSTDFK